MGDGGVERTHLEHQKTEGKLGDYIYTYNKFMKWQNEKALFEGQGPLSGPLNPWPLGRSIN